MRVNLLKLLGAVLFGSLLLAPAAPLHAAGETSNIILSPNADYFGFDYDILKNTPLEACISTCRRDRICQAFTYNQKSRWCFLKSDYGSLQAFDSTIAGRKIVGQAPAAALKNASYPAFTTAGMRKLADSLPKRLRGWYKPGSKGYMALRRTGFRALADRKPFRAGNAFGAALALYTDDSELLRAYARALLMQPDLKGKKRRLVHEVATSTLLLAYRAASGRADRSLTLAALGDILTTRKFWKMAMAAYTARLALGDDPAIAKKLAKLRLNHGFRVLKHTVDADTANPRICVQFSEDLDEDVDYNRFVRLDGKAPAALETKDDNQLCIDGVRHSTSYRLTLRGGLPSGNRGEKLEKNVDLKVYVRDRTPAVRFTGKGFVLPRIGSRGIPLVTVNTTEAIVSIYRIGERNLAPMLQKNRFLRQLTPYRAEEIGNNSGEKIWTGTLAIASERNREVTTSFPISTALPKRRPGVYFMIAKPAEGDEEDWDTQATQWFVISDIGLTSFSGREGLHVFTRSLSTAKPLDGIKLRLMARNNNVLATVTTDARGHARFDAGYTRGKGGNAPALVIAEDTTGDTVFIDLNRPAFDLSDRGVAGRNAPPPMDAFLYTERGIYRPGATIHAVALLRDQKAESVGKVPLTFIITRPDEVEYRRITVTDAGLGGYAADIPLLNSVMTGTWRIAIHANPKDDPLAEKMVLVEDFLPDRFEFDLTSNARWLRPDADTLVNLSGRFLYGAPAAGLQLDGEIRINSVRTMPGFPGYRFGLADEDVEYTETTLSDLDTTDARGKAVLNIRPDSLPEGTRPLEATITVRMLESGGRAVERSMTLPVKPQAPLIGIKPLFRDSEIGEGEQASFDVIAVGTDGRETALPGLKWQLVKLERSYQWYRGNGEWNYESVEFTRRIANGVINLKAGQAVRIAAPVGWGSYRLEIEGAEENDPASSLAFVAGWASADADADTPDFFKIALDKKTYRPGETARISLSPRFDGIALVTVMGEKLLSMTAVDVKKTGTIASLPVGDDWGAGAYVTATLFRPMDADASRNPARAIGVQWLKLDTSPRTIGVKLDLPKQFRPGQTLKLPVTLSGPGTGKEAYVTVAAVDVGILNLTGYKPPSPESWYYGQRKLGMEIRDIYGRLINGLLGATGKIRTGSGEDDESNELAMKGTPPAQKPLSLFSGIVRTGSDGKAMISLDIPQFNGTLRFMAVAWSQTGVGHASADLTVRDPVVITASLPRFMAPGDRSRLLLNIVNADGPAGRYSLTVALPPHLALDRQKDRWTLELAAGGKADLVIPIVARANGVGEISLRITHASGLDVGQKLTLGVRSAQPPLTRRMVLPLAANGQGNLRLDADMLAGLRPGSAALSLSITRAGRLDLPGLLMGLDRYPYGCTEQTTSRALPLLYLGDVAKLAGLNREKPLVERIQKAIDRVMTRMNSEGGFGLWFAGTGDKWLSAYVMEFLTRAREKGYEVPEIGFRLALDNLENSVTYNREIRDGGDSLAYALYVLARNGRASVGDLRYFADSRLEEFTSPLALAHLGAAFNFTGDKIRTATAFRAAMDKLTASRKDPLREDYGSQLRDVAAVFALAAGMKPAPVSLDGLARLLNRRQSERPYTSTQEKAWLLLAAHALLDGSDSIRLNINGASHTGNLIRRYSAAELAVPVRIGNDGSAPLDAVITVSGTPDQPRPASGSGLSITRQYFTRDGKEVPLDRITQTQRLVVVLKVHEERKVRSRLLIVDRLPAGLEIDNPTLMTSATLGGLDWLPKSSGAAHSEFRDDRFVAAMDRTPGSKRDFTLAYMVRAVSPGSFVVPPAVVEDMYRPYTNARTATGRVEVLAARR